MPQERLNNTRIIACGVFKPALDYLKLKQRFQNLHITYLTPVLHTRPNKLEKKLLSTVNLAARRNESIICLYGDCFPEIKDFCERHGIIKVSGQHCYEMLLGSERFCLIIDETAGTYFIEKDLLINFQEYCMEPLELYDDDIRQYFFEHYEKLLYVRQPNDPDLLSQANGLSEFLELSLAIIDADYSYLEDELVSML